jgi:hypothetical protein
MIAPPRLSGGGTDINPVVICWSQVIMRDKELLFLSKLDVDSVVLKLLRPYVQEWHIRRKVDSETDTRV